jgi:hypothetical protein
MTTQQHTTGPWYAHPIVGTGQSAIASKANGQSVAYAYNGQANARLIAAAPCMLLALTIARAHIRRALEEIPENDGHLAGALAVIGEAITKATGGDFE